MARIVSLAVLLQLTAACSTYYQSSPPAQFPRLEGAKLRIENCQYVESRRNWATAVGAAAAFLGGASGLATLPAESDGVKTGFAISGIALGAIGALAAVFSKSLSESYETRQCKSAYEFLKKATEELEPVVITPPRSPK